MAETINPDSGMDLSGGLQKLPQELFDEIVQFTLARLPAIITLDKSFKPPTFLQVNRRLRDSFAQEFYGSTTFQLASRQDFSVFQLYFDKLSPAHKSYITNIRIKRDRPRHFAQPNWQHDLRTHTSLVVKAIMYGILATGRIEARILGSEAQRTFQLPNTAISVNVLRRRPDGTEVEDWVSLVNL